MVQIEIKKFCKKTVRAALIAEMILSTPGVALAGGGEEGDNGSHQVTAGETLWGIAKSHGLTLDQLRQANPQITNPSLIHPGDVIYLPNPGESLVVSTAKPATKVAPAPAAPNPAKIIDAKPVQAPSSDEIRITEKDDTNVITLPAGRQIRVPIRIDSGNHARVGIKISGVDPRLIWLKVWSSDKLKDGVPVDEIPKARIQGITDPGVRTSWNNINFDGGHGADHPDDPKEWWLGEVSNEGADGSASATLTIDKKQINANGCKGSVSYTYPERFAGSSTTILWAGCGVAEKAAVGVGN